MTRALFAPPLGPQFDSFLFAAIGEDPNGKEISVLSAFARTELDPWREAASLARMPRDAATARLEAFISALPNQPNALVPARRIAGELIALLPRIEESRPRLREGWARPATRTPTKDAARFGLGISAIACLVVIAFLFWARPTTTPSGPDGAGASSDKATSRISPPDSNP